MLHLKHVFDSFFRPLFINFKNFIGSTPNNLNVLGQKFNHKRSLVFMNLFDEDVELSFYEWRLSSESTSSVLVLNVVLFVAFRACFILSTSEVMDARAIFFYSLMLFLAIFRRRLAHALGLHIYKYWIYFGYFISLSVLVSIAQLFMECRQTNSLPSCAYAFPRRFGITDIQSFSGGSFNGLTLISLLVFNLQSSHFGWYVIFVYKLK